MVIQGEDYIFTSISDSSTNYDVELLCTVKGKTESREEFKVIAYGIPLEFAIKKLIQHRISKGNPEPIDLKTYLKEYSQQVKDLKDIINGNFKEGI